MQRTSKCVEVPRAPHWDNTSNSKMVDVEQQHCVLTCLNLLPVSRLFYRRYPGLLLLVNHFFGGNSPFSVAQRHSPALATCWCEAELVPKAPSYWVTAGSLTPVADVYYWWVANDGFSRKSISKACLYFVWLWHVINRGTGLWPTAVWNICIHMYK